MDKREILNKELRVARSNGDKYVTPCRFCPDWITCDYCDYHIQIEHKGKE